MPGSASKADLMRALGQLVRGLSILFWALPLALLVFGLIWLETSGDSLRPNALAEWLHSLGLAPPLVATGLLLIGVWHFSTFQPQERVWQNAVERAKALAVVNLGLSPFLHWWNRLPFVPLYQLAVVFLFFFGLIFLLVLNQVIARLAAMLPDETLRVETRFFTTLNFYLLGFILVLLAIYVVLVQWPDALPPVLVRWLQLAEPFRQWLTVFLILIPLALTMTLIWKIKEVILASVFSPDQ